MKKTYPTVIASEAKQSLCNSAKIAARLKALAMTTGRAFTLAEVLITLAIIGVVAALTVPSVIAEYQQQEFKTGLKKAISVLNSAIMTNIALDNESPYDNSDLFNYLRRHMNILATETVLMNRFYIGDEAGNCCENNSAFYTTDGMRYEFYRGVYKNDKLPLHENGEIFVCQGSTSPGVLTTEDPSKEASCGGCGSYGLNNNPDGTTKPPCLITVDVNGDRRPTPGNANCKDMACSSQNAYKQAAPDGKKLTDIFSVMITDKEAIPYGVAAQRAMYNNK